VDANRVCSGIHIKVRVGPATVSVVANCNHNNIIIIITIDNVITGFTQYDHSDAHDVMAMT